MDSGRAEPTLNSGAAARLAPAREMPHAATSQTVTADEETHTPLTELAGLASHQGAPETAVKTLYQAGANELTATYRDSEEPPLPAARIDEAINAIESANPSTRL